MLSHIQRIVLLLFLLVDRSYAQNQMTLPRTGGNFQQPGSFGASQSPPGRNPLNADPRAARARSSTAMTPTERQALFSSALSRGRSSASKPEEAYTRLFNTPNDLGHFLGGGTTVTGFDGLVATSELPIAGGTGRINVADNNKALPADRVYFDYRHYNGALTADASQFIVGPAQETFDVNNTVIGIEKTFGANKNVSLEARIPFVSRMTFDTPNFGLEGGRGGNISLIGKGLLAIGEDYSLVAGLGVTLPTGTDVSGQLNGMQYQVQNEAVYLTPYVAMLLAPDAETTAFIPECFYTPCMGEIIDRSSFQFFAQTNVAVRSQKVVLPGFGISNEFREQSILMLDAAYAFKFCEKPENRFLKRLDGILELHYASAIDHGRPVTVGPVFNSLTFAETFQSYQLNLTSGFSAAIRENTRLQIGAAVPLSLEPRRAFDAEFIISLNQYF